MVQAINLMLDHIHAVDTKMQSMCEQIERLGGQVDDVPLPELESLEIHGGGEKQSEIVDNTSVDSKD